jgi:hypothetical protein
MPATPLQASHSTAVEASKVMTGPENFWWILGCIFTFGGLYFHKISTKRAMLEALLAHQAFNATAAPVQTNP